LKKTIREEDTLARLGGDEFTIIIGDVTSEKDIETFAQKVLDSLKEPMGIKEDIFNVSISVGISFYPKNGTDSSHLIKCADTAMYKAKECGRNNFQFFS
jgi:diguanylate cyclase (GGDEF)-like protein